MRFLGRAAWLIASLALSAEAAASSKTLPRLTAAAGPGVPRAAATSQGAPGAAGAEGHSAAARAHAFDAALDRYNNGELGLAASLFYQFLQGETQSEQDHAAPQAAQTAIDVGASADADAGPVDAGPQLEAFDAAQMASNIAWAYYFLAESLRGLGLHHAATVYYYEVAKQGLEPELLPRALERLKSIVETRLFDTRVVYDNLLDSLQVANLPGDIRDWVEFEQGRRDIQRGFDAWGDRHLANIDPNSTFAAQADYIRAVRLVRDGHDTGALALLEAVAHAPRAARDVVQMAQLALARLRFDQGDYPGALVAYAELLPQHLSFEEGLVLTEKAWTHYYLGHVAEALGALHALGAPSYESFFYPDMFLLKALIYKERCHYLSAKDVIRAFRTKFARTFEQLRARAPQERIERIRRAAVMEGPLARRTKLLLRLTDERDRILSVLPATSDKVAAHLATLYETSIQDNDVAWRQSFAQVADAVALRLLDAQEQLNVLDYEISLAIFKPIENMDNGSDIGSDKNQVLPGAAAGVQVSLDSERASIYPFDGEYWNDELGDYQVVLPDLCLGERP